MEASDGPGKLGCIEHLCRAVCDYRDLEREQREGGAAQCGSAARLCGHVGTPHAARVLRHRAKWVSLIVKFGALVFIVWVPSQFAIYLQLLGGIWIISNPAIAAAGCLYPLVQRLGAAAWLGGWHRHRHRDGSRRALFADLSTVPVGLQHPGLRGVLF